MPCGRHVQVRRIVFARTSAVNPADVRSPAFAVSDFVCPRRLMSRSETPNGVPLVRPATPSSPYTLRPVGSRREPPRSFGTCRAGPAASARRQTRSCAASGDRTCRLSDVMVVAPPKPTPSRTTRNTSSTRGISSGDATVLRRGGSAIRIHYLHIADRHRDHAADSTLSHLAVVLDQLADQGVDVANVQSAPTSMAAATPSRSADR